MLANNKILPKFDPQNFDFIESDNTPIITN